MALAKKEGELCEKSSVKAGFKTTAQNFLFFKIQKALLNGITVNGIIQSMGSNTWSSGKAEDS